MEFKQDRNQTSQELTVVFLRGNGSPRSFRVKVPAIQKSILTVSLALSAATLVAIVSLVLFFFGDVGRKHHSPTPAPVVSAPIQPTTTAPAQPTPIENTAPAEVAAKPAPTIPLAVPQPSTTATPALPAAETPRPSWLSGLRSWFSSPSTAPLHSSSSGSSNANASEMEQELEGLRADLAKLNAKLDGRRELPKEGVILQLLSPRSELVPAAESPAKIRGISAKREAGTQELLLDFELYNSSATLAQVRGYILVIAKSLDAIAVYPSGAFSPTENILVNYSKGETFAISRGRLAHARFPLGAFGKDKIQFQIMLFGTDGKILVSEQWEEK